MRAKKRARQERAPPAARVTSGGTGRVLDLRDYAYRLTGADRFDPMRMRNVAVPCQRNQGNGDQHVQATRHVRAIVMRRGGRLVLSGAYDRRGFAVAIAWVRLCIVAECLRGQSPNMLLDAARHGRLSSRRDGDCEGQQSPERNVRSTSHACTLSPERGAGSSAVKAEFST